MKPLTIDTSPEQLLQARSSSSHPPHSAAFHDDNEHGENDRIFNAQASPSRVGPQTPTPTFSQKPLPIKSQLAVNDSSPAEWKRIVAHSIASRNDSLSPYKPIEPETARRASPATTSPAYRVRNIHSAGKIYDGPNRFVDRISFPSRQTLQTAPLAGVSPTDSAGVVNTKLHLGNLSPLQAPYTFRDGIDDEVAPETFEHSYGGFQTGTPHNTGNLRWTSTLEVPYPLYRDDRKETDELEEQSIEIKSVNTSMFIDMELEDMLTYIDKKDMETKTSTFLHVTPRYNLENVSKMNLYDLIVLEKPGDSSSGYVWASRTSAKDGVQTLKHNQLFTLSKAGVIFPSSGPHEMSGIVKLSDFLREKKLVQELRGWRVFNHFKQCKIFVTWKQWVRRVSYRRAHGKISCNTVLSDGTLIATLFYIRNVAREIEDNVDLFYYNEKGGLMWSCDYLDSQTAKIKQCGLEIFQKLDILSKYIKEKYYYLSSEDHLKTHTLAATEAVSDLDLSNVRFVQRKREEYQEKIQKLLVVAQLLLENSYSYILNRLWKTCMKYIKGVAKVHLSPQRGAGKKFPGYWDCNANIKFQSDIDRQRRCTIECESLEKRSRDDQSKMHDQGYSSDWDTNSLSSNVDEPERTKST